MDVESAEKGTDKKIVFFGCALDSDERHESIQEKLACMRGVEGGGDPYPFIMEFIRKEVDPRLWDEIGSLEVPDWLLPVPPAAVREYIIADNFVSFIDDDGCRTFADMLGEHVISQIFPHVPCLLGVDHSLTGGVFKKLAELYAPEKISLIVVDSHTDAIPTSVMSGAIEYDMEKNPNSVFDPNDPFLANRKDSYNASSFLCHLLEDGVIEPENLYIVGVSDYPSKRFLRINDKRIKKYAGLYPGLKRKGVKIVTKKDLLRNHSKVRELLRQIATPYIYISIDMDIGACNALEAVRFRNRRGLNEVEIYSIADHLQKLLSRGINLAGMDISEINPRKAIKGDRTYRIASRLIWKLCFGFE